MLFKTPEIEAAAQSLLARTVVDESTGCRLSPNSTGNVSVRGLYPINGFRVLWVYEHGFIEPGVTLVSTCGTKGCIAPGHRVARQS